MYRTVLQLSFFLYIFLFSLPLVADPACLPFSEFSRRFWGAKFLKGYKPFDFRKHPMTVGVEVELITPVKVKYRNGSRSYQEPLNLNELNLEGATQRGQVRERLAQIIYNTIQKKFPYIQLGIKRDYLLGEYEYTVQYKLNDRLYEYEVKEDISIEAPPVYIGVEIASPKLYNQKDIKLFYDILKELRAEGKVKTSFLSGVHVHVGFPHANPQEVALTLALFSQFEKQIYTAFSVLPYRRTEYANFVGDKTLHFLQQKDIFTINDLIGIVKDRNQGLNIRPLKDGDFKTLEFRLFNSSFKSAEIDRMIKFSRAFVKSIREKHPQLLKLIFENRDLEAVPFKTLVEILGLKKQDMLPVEIKRRSVAY